MKLLTIHVKRLTFRERRRSSRPSGVGQSDGTVQSVVQALVALVSVEENDTLRESEQAAVSIEDLANLNHVGKVMVVPFVHLTSRIARSPEAMARLQEIVQKLQMSTLGVERASFGFHKDFSVEFDSIDAYGHPCSIAFRSFPDTRLPSSRRRKADSRTHDGMNQGRRGRLRGDGS